MSYDPQATFASSWPHQQRPLRPSKPQRRHRPQRNSYGDRVAVLKALAAASLWLGLPLKASTLDAASRITSASKKYVGAAAEVLRSGDAALLSKVEHGDMSLTAAAKLVRKRNRLVRALREASPEDVEAVLTNTLHPAHSQ
jgi:hypothetical protein